MLEQTRSYTMNVKLTIFVGHVNLAAPAKFYSKCMSNKTVKSFHDHIAVLRSNNVSFTLRVYTDTIIIWACAQLGSGNISLNNITVITEEVTHQYGDEELFGQTLRFRASWHL